MQMAVGQSKGLAGIECKAHAQRVHVGILYVLRPQEHELNTYMSPFKILGICFTRQVLVK